MRKDQLLSAIFSAACLTLGPMTAHAQCTRSCGFGSFVTLHSFTGQPDGANPQASLIQDSAGNFYGTTTNGGTSGLGTVFKLDASGTETIVYSFAGQPDGANPQAGLVLNAGGNLYGTTTSGGTANFGTVFKVDPTGKATILYSFTGAADGSKPLAGLVTDSSGDFYGTTDLGGASGAGVVFKVDTTGKETVLHSFTGGTDGAFPRADLLLDASGNFYSATSGGGTFDCLTGGSHSTGCGTVFKLDTTGTETVLYSFLGKNAGPDGAFPAAALVRDSSGNLYGTTFEGGTGSGPCYVIAMNPPQPPADIYCGTVFKLDAGGAETVLHRFTGAPDGVGPHGPLVSDGTGNLYGTTFYGGTGGCVESGGRPGVPPVVVGCGTIFKIDSSGNETVLYNFTGGSDGGGPQAGLKLDGQHNLYGTTYYGGMSNAGTVFQFTPGTAPTTFTLSVALAGSGSGTVTSSPAGIDCGSQCSANFDTGIAVTLTPAAASGSTFSAWSGACSGSGACTVTVSTAESVTATFNATQPADFSLTPASTNLALQPGAQATDVITIAPQNGAFANAIQLSCSVSGPSPMPTCGLSPASLTPGANSATATLTVSVPTSAELVRLMPSTGRLIGQDRNMSNYALSLPCLFGIILFGLGVFSIDAQRRNQASWLVFGLAAVAILGQFGCGGGGSTMSQPKSYTVTVKAAASGDIQHTTQITVSVP